MERNRAKLAITKYVGKQVGAHLSCYTLFAAYRAVIFGTILILLGLIMTIVGYFDEELATEKRFDVSTEKEQHVINLVKRYQLKSLQYIGPVIMGVGSFILMIFCVMTLESRDRHAQFVGVPTIKKEKRTKKASVTRDMQMADERQYLAERISFRLPSRLGTDQYNKCSKYPSTSCLDSMSRQVDTETLLQRFLDDQSQTVSRQRIVTVEVHRPSSDHLSMQRVQIWPTRRPDGRVSDRAQMAVNDSPFESDDHISRIDFSNLDLRIYAS